MRPSPRALAVLLLASPASGQDLPAPVTRAVDYAADVEPLLRGCVECHGPRKQRKSLRVDSRAALLAGGRSGPAVLPGRSADSPLVRRVAGIGGRKRMPPKGEPLSAEQIAVLRAWIEQGASGPAGEVQAAARRHWAYLAPVRPSLPAAGPDAGWSQNPIDRFVWAQLVSHDLEPSPAAERAVWLRRVSFDLTGLPPTIEEVAAFVTDDGTDAHEKVVDRLLASPHYGERWAQMWLDLARYADTKGYEKDGRRSIWRYRDWVINAFNRDVPFDEFTRDQLAGDLLPEPRLEQLVATAFHRNTMTNDEGGTDDEEFRVEAVADRVETTMQVWMGTTIGCVRCHEHKYDPFEHREYYELFAFFNNTEDADRPDDSPTIVAYTGEQRAELARLEAVRSRLAAILREELPELAVARQQWERSAEAAFAEHRRRPPELGSWSAVGPYAAESAKAAFEAAFAPESGAEGLDWVEHAEWQDGVVHNQPLRGVNAANYLRRDIEVETARTVTLSLGSDDAIVVWLNGEQILARNVMRGAAPDQERVTVELPAGKSRLLLKIVNGGGPTGFYFRLLPSTLPDAVVGAFETPAGKRSAEQREQIADAFRERAPELAPVREALAQLQKQIDAVVAPTVPVLRELPADKRRTTHILERGSFLSRGEPVEPGVPAVLSPLPAGASRDRLLLAQWLTARDNPLTARVFVNRLWERLFGRGLVETSEDFGTQGEPPTHPALLDWLACDLMEDGWSLKNALRRIVTSSTYRQSSTVRAAAHRRDPQNRWLWRGPVFRLPAEMVRDQALAVTGLLSRRMFGPSVMPHQPDGLWQVVYSNDRWVTSAGDERHRRGIYTFWRRTNPYPSMVTFDAPSREFCVVRRDRTNTPLQALVTLNDPVFVEAAQALARRIVAEAGPDARRRAAFGVRVCLAREPRAAELDRLVQLFETERSRFRADRGAAAKMIGVDGSASPEIAAWTAVANVLLNLDEFLNKG